MNLYLLMENDKKLYDNYYCECVESGDVWNIHFSPFSFSEWLELGKPKRGGVQVSPGKLPPAVMLMVVSEREEGAVYRVNNEE